jgi:hypothetical protein
MSDEDLRILSARVGVLEREAYILGHVLRALGSVLLRTTIGAEAESILQQYRQDRERNT